MSGAPSVERHTQDAFENGRAYAFRNLVGHAIHSRHATALHRLLRSTFFAGQASSSESAGMSSDLAALLEASPAVLPTSELPFVWAHRVRHERQVTAPERVLLRAYRGLRPGARELAAFASGADMAARVRLALQALSPEPLGSDSLPIGIDSVLAAGAIVPAALAIVGCTAHGHAEDAQVHVVHGRERALAWLLAAHHPIVPAALRIWMVEVGLATARGLGGREAADFVRILALESHATRTALLPRIAELLGHYPADALLGAMLGAAARLLDGLPPEAAVKALAEAAAERVRSCLRTSALPEAYAHLAQIFALAGQPEAGMQALRESVQRSAGRPPTAAVSAFVHLVRHVAAPAELLNARTDFGRLASLLCIGLSEDVAAFRRAGAALKSGDGSARTEIWILDGLRDAFVTGQMQGMAAELVRLWEERVARLVPETRQQQRQDLALALEKTPDSPQVAWLLAEMQERSEPDRVALLRSMLLAGNSLFGKFTRELLRGSPPISRLSLPVAADRAEIDVFAAALCGEVEGPRMAARAAWAVHDEEALLSYLIAWVRQAADRFHAPPLRTFIAAASRLPSARSTLEIRKTIERSTDSQAALLLEALTLAARRSPAMARAIPPGWVENLALPPRDTIETEVRFQANRLELLALGGAPLSAMAVPLTALYDLCVRHPETVLASRWELLPDPGESLALAWLDRGGKNFVDSRHAGVRRSAMVLLSLHLAQGLADRRHVTPWLNLSVAGALNSAARHRALSFALLTSVPAFEGASVRLGDAPQTILDLLKMEARSGVTDHGPAYLRFAAEAADVCIRSRRLTLAEEILRRAVEQAAMDVRSSAEMTWLGFSILHLALQGHAVSPDLVTKIRRMAEIIPGGGDSVALLDGAMGAQAWPLVVAELSDATVNLWVRRCASGTLRLGAAHAGPLIRRAMDDEQAADRLAATIVLEYETDDPEALLKLLEPHIQGDAS